MPFAMMQLYRLPHLARSPLSVAIMRACLPASRPLPQAPSQSLRQMQQIAMSSATEVQVARR